MGKLDHTSAKLKHIVKRLQKGLNFSSMNAPVCEELGASSHVIKKGHFAVIAVDQHGGESKRFIVGIKYLKHPCFLRLLEQAAEEFGFDQEGAIVVPCRPCELERILFCNQELEEDSLR